MSIVSVINYKGGVGKTTCTANLAAELAWRGRRVLLLDMDSQASLTFSFVRPEDWAEHLEPDKTIKAWFDSYDNGKPITLKSLVIEPKTVAECLRSSGSDGRLDLISSHLGLINVDLELATDLGGATLQKARTNFLKVHRRLGEELRPLADEYDVVLVDCPPNFNIVTKNAIVASDCLLVPAKPDYLSTLGIDYLKRNLDQLIQDYNEFAQLGGGHEHDIHPEFLGVVFTMIQVRSGKPIGAQRPYMSQIEQLGVPVFSAWIRENKTKFSNSPEYGVPVVLTQEGSHDGNTYARIVAEIEDFVSEFEDKLC